MLYTKDQINVQHIKSDVTKIHSIQLVLFFTMVILTQCKEPM